MLYRHRGTLAGMGLRQAINDKCKDCIYDPESGGGTWREQVAQCSAISCPLWPYRPMPGSGQFANAPRDPAKVTREWLTKPVGEAVSALLPDASLSGGTEGGGEDENRS